MKSLGAKNNTNKHAHKQKNRQADRMTDRQEIIDIIIKINNQDRSTEKLHGKTE